jgi:hypothetical protein
MQVFNRRERPRAEAEKREKGVVAGFAGRITERRWARTLVVLLSI